jgi:hypothetical protein
MDARGGLPPDGDRLPVSCDPRFDLVDWLHGTMAAGRDVACAGRRSLPGKEVPVSNVWRAIVLAFRPGSRALPEAPAAFWIPDELVALRRRGEPVRLMVGVRRSRCPLCDTGTRTDTVWSSLRGRMESIAWCGHCFNAVSARVSPSPAELTQFVAVGAAYREGQPVRHFNCARDAARHVEAQVRARLVEEPVARNATGSPLKVPSKSPVAQLFACLPRSISSRTR